MRLRDEIRQDALRYDAGVGGLSRLAWLVVRHPGLRALVLYRVGRTMLLHGHRGLARICSEAARQLSHCDISLAAKLGPGLRMPHPTGVVIGADVVVGEQCAIQQNVTLGGNYGRIRDGRVMPTLGARVAVSAGAVVVGPVVIGDDVVIGANVVVTRDVVSGTRLAAPRPVEIPESLEQRL